MESILIKDTTREQRERIVHDSLGYSEIGCEFEDTGIDYDEYIDGRKELAQLSAEYKANYIKACPDDPDGITGMSCPGPSFTEE
jgi:hypothetical protein